MKKGICIWAFAEPDWAICFQKAREAGYDGVEVLLAEDGPLHLHSTEEEILAVKAMAERENMALYSVASHLYWQYPLTSNDPAVRDKAMHIARKQLNAAALLGCDTVLIVPGQVDPATPYDVAYERALCAMQALAPYAGEKGVTIGVENVWNRFLLSPLEMRDFIDRVGHSRVAAYFDVGNVLRDGYPEQWIRILGRRIAKVHVKDYRVQADGAGFVDLLNGDVDFPAVIGALKEIGYDGWITAELAPYPRFPEVLPYTSSLALDTILGRGCCTMHEYT